AIVATSQRLRAGLLSQFGRGLPPRSGMGVQGPAEPAANGEVHEVGDQGGTRPQRGRGGWWRVSLHRHPEQVYCKERAGPKIGTTIHRLSDSRQLPAVKKAFSRSLGEGWMSGLIGGTARRVEG